MTSPRTIPCDVCDAPVVFAERHTVRLPRSSDPLDLSAILWTCGGCGPSVGAKTEAEWDEYIESDEAREAGHIFLT